MQLRFADCLLDSGTREVFRGQTRIHVSPKAFQLLDLLIGHRPNALSKEEIHRNLWPESFVADGNVANLVNELRVTLGDNSRSPRIIRTVQRFGYAFVAEAERLEATKAPEREEIAYRLVWGDREIALAPGDNDIGRYRGSVVWVDDVAVSRHHARIVVDPSGARLEDLGSKNGTFLGGKRIGHSAILSDRDVLRVGAAAMMFRAFTRTSSTVSAAEPDRRSEKG